MTYSPLTLYCNCFHKSEHEYTQFNQKNLMLGASSITDASYRAYLTNRGYLFDDTLDNISDLNKWVGDLTGLYWIWKNTNDEFVGTNQYRRFWDDEFVSTLKLDQNSLYISAPLHFEQSAYDQYIRWCGEIGFHILYEASSQNKINMTANMIDVLKQIKSLSSCNMFFGHRTVFNKVCEILFEIIFELYNGVKYSLPYIQTQGELAANKPQTRMLAFLSERILTMMFVNKEYYFGNMNIVMTPWRVI